MALPATVRRAFETALGPENVITDPVRCRAYECDGLTGYRVVPELVLLPRDAAQVAAAVRVCAEHRVPFVARGAGTGLSGGALPVADGVVISLARLKRVLEVDPVDRRADRRAGRHEPGDHRGGRAARALLRARPEQPAGLHDRRQRRGELRRRALPQVRVHHEPRAGARGRAGRRVGGDARLGHRRAGGAGPARGVPRLRGHAGDHHEDRRAAAAHPGVGADAARRLPVGPARRATSSATSSAPGSCPPPSR